MNEGENQERIQSAHLLQHLRQSVPGIQEESIPILFDEFSRQ